MDPITQEKGQQGHQHGAELPACGDKHVLTTLCGSSTQVAKTKYTQCCALALSRVTANIDKSVTEAKLNNLASTGLSPHRTWRGYRSWALLRWFPCSCSRWSQRPGWTWCSTRRGWCRPRRICHGVKLDNFVNVCTKAWTRPLGNSVYLSLSCHALSGKPSAPYQESLQVGRNDAIWAIWGGGVKLRPKLFSIQYVWLDQRHKKFGILRLRFVVAWCQIVKT